MAHSVLVSGLTSNITSDKVEIHFLKKCNGGADVSKVDLIGEGKAIVEFEDEAGLQRVLQKSHRIMDVTVNVEKYDMPTPRMRSKQKLVCRVEMELNQTILANNGLDFYQLSKMAQEYHGVTICNGTAIVVIADSLDKLVKFEMMCKKLIKNTSASALIMQEPPPPSNPKVQRISNVQRSKSLVDESRIQEFETTSLPVTNGGAIGYDSMTPEWSDSPFPQPKNGFTVSETVNINGSSVIKRKFGFPEDVISIPGDFITYESFQCTICLPSTPSGKAIDDLLKEAFITRKLFYVGKDTQISGFSIQSAYNIIPRGDDDSEIEINGKKMVEVRSRLLDLGISAGKKLDRGGSEPSLQADGFHGIQMEKNLEPDIVYSVPVPKEEPLKDKSTMRFPQPNGFNVNAEYHKKDLPGFQNSGAIHIYFRYSGGILTNENGNTEKCLSYSKTACLPANDQGRVLYGMIMNAVKNKKLFVATYKAKNFMIRSKVQLLTSDDYSDLPENYLENVYGALLKIGIPHPSPTPQLPSQSSAHHSESSDDEEEDKKLEILRKGGPFLQPEKGVIRLEKDSQNLKGLAGSGSIKIYMRFNGGKMRIEGYKPSKSFEVQYSQSVIVAALPCSNEGKILAAMLRAAFMQQKLFKVEKRDGEPSFRVRPKVTLLTADQYPKNGYLLNLKRQLTNLEISEPSEHELANLVIHNATSPQGGSLPPNWGGTNQQAQNLDPSASASMRSVYANRGARPKQLMNSRIRPQVHIPPRVNSSADKTTKFGTMRQRFPSQPQPKWQATNQSTVKKYQVNFAANQANNSKEKEKCAICLAELSQPTKRLPCKHEFHVTCIDMALKAQQQQKKCPYCNQALKGNSSPATNASPVFQTMPVVQQNYQPPINAFGNQFQPFVAPNYSPQTSTSTPCKLPGGSMTQQTEPFSLPGFEGARTIIIRYDIPGGVQQNNHPNPGARYDSTRREAYLPDNAEGQELSRLLKRAFDAGLIFTIGRSQTSGRDNQIIWNGIRHKTNRHGGRAGYGYPDGEYLNHLRQDLASKGIR